MNDKIKTIIIIIIFALIFTVSLVMILDRKEPNDKDLITIENENVNNTNTTREVKEDENNITDNNNIEENNLLNENTTSDVVGREEKESEKEDDSSENKDQKAIELVKKEWGNDDNSVYFNIANKNGNKYTISVNSSETTEVIAWYDVDLETQKVTSN